MKRFLTIFLKAENIHLTKDVGMIPYFLHKEYEYDSTIACYKNGQYNYLNNEVKGLKVVFVKKIFNNEFLDTLLFLFNNAKQYDILQMYHLSRLRSVLLFVYKLLAQSNAKTYMKLDAGDYILDFRYSGLIGKVYHFLVKKIDIISVENKKLFNKLNDENILKRPVIYIPNGYYETNDNEKVEKENTFLTVGRIGTYQKNTESLLQAFKDFALVNNTWKLQIVGPVEHSFKKYIDDFFIKFPHLLERISFTGLINDKITLALIYQKASIFILPSRYEGFPLVYLEAIKAGCYIITSDISSAKDIVDEGKYGKLFPVEDHEALLECMVSTVENIQEIHGKIATIKKFARENFYWPVIIKKLHSKLVNESV